MDGTTPSEETRPPSPSSAASSSPSPLPPQALRGSAGVVSHRRAPQPCPGSVRPWRGPVPVTSLAISVAGDAVRSVSTASRVQQVGNFPSELIRNLSTSHTCGLGTLGAEITLSGPVGTRGHWRGSDAGGGRPRFTALSPGAAPTWYGGSSPWETGLGGNPSPLPVHDTCPQVTALGNGVRDWEVPPQGTGMLRGQRDSGSTKADLHLWFP